MITTEKTLREQPLLVKSFMKAVVESQKWAVTHPEEAVRSLLGRSSSLSYENELEVWKATIPFLVVGSDLAGIGHMRQERWRETADILIKYAGLPPNAKITEAYATVEMSDPQ